MTTTQTFIILLAVAIVLAFVIGYALGKRAQAKQNQKLEDTTPTSNLATITQLHDAAELIIKAESLNSELKNSLIKLADSEFNIDIQEQFITKKEAATTPMEAPRDWAPKNTDKPGTLSEEYGLKDEVKNN